MSEIFAKVIIEISHEKVDRPFEYRVPENLTDKVVPGCEVTIPFGNGNKEITGYVIGLSKVPEYDISKIKSIIGVNEKSVTAKANLMALASFIKDRYGSTMIDAIKTVLPVKKIKKAVEKKTIIAKANVNELMIAAAEAERKHQNAKHRLLSELIENSELSYSLVTGKLNVSGQTVLSLQKAELITVEVTKTYRNPVSFRDAIEKRVELSSEQEYICNEVNKDCMSGNPGVYLIHGITGSGKTEVYMKLIEDRIKEGKQAILLIPEISLTYQNVLRFYRRFGDKVSVMHSKLSEGEKFDQFERAKKGEISIMIGPRSALFTPFENLGIIVIDEEHETTYKSENVPKYHAREVAIKLAQMNNAPVILGSATPSMESYTKALEGEYRLFTMTKRLTGGTLPNVDVVDMREELKNGNKSIFSGRLKSLMDIRLERGEQIMLFLNRRGMAGFVSCRSCGKVIKCPHCDVSLSQHRNGKLMCHYCGYETTMPECCPECGSKKVAGFKAGTEQIEELVKKTFPQAIVLRMDADTTKSKDDYETILSKFANREADILIGTQMIVKGHDFKGVTLVGILAADLSLSNTDYRAGERTFQLLTQAAGRAGRGDRPGDVVIQTYQPEHYAVQFASAQDYEGFYREEMAYRKIMMYPPGANLLAVQILGENEEELGKAAEIIASFAKNTATGDRTVCIGPGPALLSKKKDIFRKIIYYKNIDYDCLVRVKDIIENRIEENPLGKIRVMFDFNPMNTF